MNERTKQKIDIFFEKNNNLLFLKNNIFEACTLILDTFINGGKLLVCGNGGSCADADHIVGELMKGFLLKRPLDENIKFKFKQYFGNEGSIIAKKLQGSLPAISLGAHSAFNTAFINDVDAVLMYAQQVIAYGKKGDTIIGISTSGNAANVYYAFMAAKVKGLKCIALCGMDGGKISALSDCSIIAPSNETYRIQEYHTAIYHLICAVVESEIFEI